MTKQYNPLLLVSDIFFIQYVNDTSYGLAGAVPGPVPLISCPAMKACIPIVVTRFISSRRRLEMEKRNAVEKLKKSVPESRA